MLDRQELAEQLAKKPYLDVEDIGDKALIAQAKMRMALRRIDTGSEVGRERAGRLERGMRNSEAIPGAVEDALLKLRIRAHRPAS